MAKEPKKSRKVDYNVMPTLEEFENGLVYRKELIKTIQDNGIYVVELGKVRGNGFYPKCDICDTDASYSLQFEWIYNSKVFTIHNGNTFADGKPCKLYKACYDHLNEVVKVMNKEGSNTE
jgi:hypothetical protein